MKAELAIRLPEPEHLSTLAAANGTPVDEDSRSELVFPEGYVAGQTPEMRAVYRQMEIFGTTDLPVLILGETGVGKEPLARTLHDSSGRRGPLVALNCAAFPTDLLEAELFGIASGVATGVAARDGKFHKADGGSLFLDEIAEMPPRLQAKLLRVLQEREVLPLGGEPVPVDARILAATNVDLDRRIADGAFRADLYFRLAGAILEVPPLRRRPTDIPALVEHFLLRFATSVPKLVRGVTVAALDVLAQYPWPGNVRELEHEVRKLVLLCPHRQAIDVEHLPLRLRAPAGTEASGARADFPSDTLHLETLEKHAIRKALEQCGGNQVRASELLGISRFALRRRMERHGLGTEPV